jgi:hypothetical protein
LLLLSGIGDKTTLDSHNIPAIVDLADVGKGLQDHPFVPFQWLVNSTLTFDSVSQSTTLAADAFAQYSVNGTGLLVNGLANHLAFLRVPPGTFRDGVDPSSGPKSAHIEFAFCVSFLLGPFDKLSSPIYLERIRHHGGRSSVHRELSDDRCSPCQPSIGYEQPAIKDSAHS